MLNAFQLSGLLQAQNLLTQLPQQSQANLLQSQPSITFTSQVSLLFVYFVSLILLTDEDRRNSAWFELLVSFFRIICRIQVAFEIPIMSSSVGWHIAAVVSHQQIYWTRGAWNDISNSVSFSIAAKQIFGRLLGTYCSILGVKENERGIMPLFSPRYNFSSQTQSSCWSQ